MERLKIDELNIIKKYFSEMELPQEEIDARIEMAEKFLDVFKRAFTIVKAEKTIDEGFDEDFLTEFLGKEYADILFDLDVLDIAKMHILSIIETTYSQVTQEYYTSDKRAMNLALDETNAYSNFQYDVKMRSLGYKKKVWCTMCDAKVRPTHIMADGQEKLIGEPFIVGGYEMLFPMDGSLGASAEEIINCRCVAKYH